MSELTTAQKLRSVDDATPWNVAHSVLRLQAANELEALQQRYDDAQKQLFRLSSELQTINKFILPEELTNLRTQNQELREALIRAIHDIDNPGDVLPRSRSTLSMATQQMIREALALKP